MDHFSCWFKAVTTSSPDAKSVAKYLYREAFHRFGVADKISSDNWRAFHSQGDGHCSLGLFPDLAKWLLS